MKEKVFVIDAGEHAAVVMIPSCLWDQKWIKLRQQQKSFVKEEKYDNRR
jgi:hypothetical protein